MSPQSPEAAEFRNETEAVVEGQCYIKTVSDHFKSHWAIVYNTDLFIYRRQGEPTHRLMHSLSGTFVKEMKEEDHSDLKMGVLHPVKITIPPNKSRILYFKEKSTQQLWITRLNQAIGFSNLFDYYQIIGNLG